MYNAAFLKLAYLLHMLNMMALLNMQNYDDIISLTFICHQMMGFL